MFDVGRAEVGRLESFTLLSQELCPRRNNLDCAGSSWGKWVGVGVQQPGYSMQGLT